MSTVFNFALCYAWYQHCWNRAAACDVTGGVAGIVLVHSSLTDYTTFAILLSVWPVRLQWLHQNHQHTYIIHSLRVQVQPLFSCPWSAIETCKEREEGKHTHTQSAIKCWGGSGGGKAYTWVLVRLIFMAFTFSLPPQPIMVAVRKRLQDSLLLTLHHSV